MLSVLPASIRCAQAAAKLPARLPVSLALARSVAALCASLFLGSLSTSFADDSSITNSFNSIGNPFKSSNAGALPSQPAPDDPVSLTAKAKPGVELFVSVARVYEEGGKFHDAEEQYRSALKIAPNDIRVLLGYARLKDRMGDFNESDKYYKKAAAKYPQMPAVFNNMAGHYSQHGLATTARESMETAVRLSPREPRYRTNLAALLVAENRNQDAFAQLRSVYDDPVAHYNLGFLLNRQGDKRAAVQQFAIALQMNPRLGYARQYLDRIAAEGGTAIRPVAPAGQPAVAPPMMAEQTNVQSNTMPPANWMPGGNMPPNVNGQFQQTVGGPMQHITVSQPMNAPAQQQLQDPNGQAINMRILPPPGEAGGGLVPVNGPIAVVPGNAGGMSYGQANVGQPAGTSSTWSPNNVAGQANVANNERMPPTPAPVQQDGPVFRLPIVSEAGEVPPPNAEPRNAERPNSGQGQNRY